MAKSITEISFTQLNIPHLPQLYPHQQETVDRAPKKRLLAYDTGTGKTLTSISLCNKHNIQTLLVICPKTNVVQWKQELEKYINTGTQCLILSKEEFKKQVKALDQRDAVICDESHMFAGISSALSKSLYWYLNKKYQIEIVYLCTATPYCSTPLNIYTLAKHLGATGDEWNYNTFKNKFFYYIPMGGRQIPMQRKGMEDEIAKLVQKIGDTVDKREAIPNYIDPTDELIDIPLSKEQIDAIRDNFDPVFIVRWTKQHQIENGFVYNDGEPTRLFDNKKLDTVIDLSNKYKKIIIVSRYTEQIEIYERELIKCGHKVLTLTGQSKDRQTIIDTANSESEIILLIQASVSAGYELPSFERIVFASLSFSSVDHVQMRGRIDRINKVKNNKYIYLVADGMDRDVYSCIQRKQDYNIAIYNVKDINSL